MKRIISLTLVALMLATLLLTATSCSMEGITGYTRLRDHVIAQVGVNGTLAMDGSSFGFTSAAITAPIKKGEDTPSAVYVTVQGADQTNPVVLNLKLDGSTEKAALTYRVYSATTGEILISADSTILLTHYTGNEPVEFTAFTDVENIAPVNEHAHRESVTSTLNSLLIILDTYTTENLNMDLHDLGFIVLSEKYMATVEGTEAEVEEDLGGALSPARLQKAGLMIIQGMGMVFLVLAVLWLVLLIFKKIFYKEEGKTPKVEKAPKAEAAPAVSAAPVAPAAPTATDDGQLVAAITAAVAAYIESDPGLSAQFASGFRVVSFRKKNGKTSWNH